jgi:thiamine kinase-like enzyme
LVEKDGIAPHLLYSNPETGNLIAPFIKGTAFGKKDGKWLYERTESIQRIAALLRSFHAHQSPVETQINYPFHIIEEYVQQALSSSISLPKNIGCALEIVHRMKSLIPPNRQVLCHQDLVPDNFIFDGSRLYLVDWEYADWGNPFYDLAAVCVEHQFNEEEKQMLLKNYFQTPTEQQRYVLEMMCMLYSLRDCLWYILESGRSQKNFSAFHELADVHYRNFFASQRWLRGCLQSLIFSKIPGFHRGVSHEKALSRRSIR